MKNKLLILLVVFASIVLLTGCSKSDPLTIWVGAESEEFYVEQMATYVANYITENGEDFPYDISVKGVDTGTAAATFLEDSEAGADIFTVAHDCSCACFFYA